MEAAGRRLTDTDCQRLLLQLLPSELMAAVPQNQRGADAESVHIGLEGDFVPFLVADLRVRRWRRSRRGQSLVNPGTDEIGHLQTQKRPLARSPLDAKLGSRSS